MKKLVRGKEAIKRDAIVSVLPWVCYGLGFWLGREVLGMVCGMLGLLLFRFNSWREIKLYEICVVLAFFWVSAAGYGLDLQGVRDWSPVWLPLFLFSGATLSLWFGRPFSLQYARQFARKEWWGNPHFLKVNRIITCVWSLVFLLGAFLSVSMVAIGTPGRLSLAAMSFLMFVLALTFTRVYPRWYRKHRYLPSVRAGHEPYMKAPEL